MNTISVVLITLTSIDLEFTVRISVMHSALQLLHCSHNVQVILLFIRYTSVTIFRFIVIFQANDEKI
jgi:hypothetical protein